LAEKRLMIPSLAPLGQESGFAVTTTTATLLRIRTYQAGKLALTREFHLDGPAVTRRWRSDWAADLETGIEELHTLEVVGERTEIEGEILFRANDRSQQVAVLTNMVPCREPGFKFNPILHQAHYNIFAGQYDTYVVHTNLVGEGDPPAQINKLQIEVRNLSAEVLAVEYRELRFNTTWLLPVRKFAQELGLLIDRGLSLRLRGGASQFAIFTVYHQSETNSIGIEHSLPPIYFTEAPFNPDLRKRYVKAAFGDLQGMP
jgi:hypothetical protein